MGGIITGAARKMKPLTAATLNFCVWGLGYLFNRTRCLLGASLLLLWLTLWFGIPASLDNPGVFHVMLALLVACWVFVGVALSRDPNRRLTVVSLASFMLVFWLGILAGLLSPSALYIGSSVLVACWLFAGFALAWDAYIDAKRGGRNA